jgi:hypothetical protein
MARKQIGGLRGRVAHTLSELDRGTRKRTSRNKNFAQRAASDLTHVAEDIRKRLLGGESSRSAASRKAAATRKRNAAKRSERSTKSSARGAAKDVSKAAKSVGGTVKKAARAASKRADAESTRVRGRRK